jgi:hypothetical protein
MKIWNLKLLMADAVVRDFRVSSNSYQSVVDNLQVRYPDAVILDLNEEKTLNLDEEIKK